MIITPTNWLKEPDENNKGLLQGDGTYLGIPLPIETHNVSLKDVTVDKEQEFEITIKTDFDYEVYENEDSYNASDHIFASQSLIPSGLNCYPDEIEPEIILTGIVTNVAEDSTTVGYNNDAIFCTIECLESEFNCVIGTKNNDVKNLKIGNVISGCFHVQGRPANRKNIIK